MSGYASYSDAHDSKNAEPHLVPLIPCNENTFREFGRLVHDFDNEEVWITTWPQTGWRPICGGTGNQGWRWAESRKRSCWRRLHHRWYWSKNSLTSEDFMNISLNRPFHKYLQLIGETSSASRFTSTNANLVELCLMEVFWNTVCFLVRFV